MTIVEGRCSFLNDGLLSVFYQEIRKFMYRVTYYFNNSNAVASKEFQSFKEATDFSIKQPINSIIEIKYYDDKTNNIQNEPNLNR